MKLPVVVTLSHQHIAAVVVFFMYGAKLAGLVAACTFLLLGCLSVMLHEVGHFLCARMFSIPVYAVHLTSGEALVGIGTRAQRRWVIGKSLGAGHIVIPRLVPTTERGWNKVVWLALAGPLVSLALFAAGIVLAATVDNAAWRMIGVSLAAANALLTLSAGGDYLLAHVAYRRDIARLRELYSDDVSERFELA